MFAVIWKDKYGEGCTLVSIHLMEADADKFIGTNVNPEQYEVREFDFDWSRWIEARKTLGIY